MKATIPMRTVLEWDLFPPEESGEQIFMFVSRESGYLIGFFRNGSVYAWTGHEFSEVEDDTRETLVMQARLPEDLLAEINWNATHHNDLDLSEEPPGSERVIELLTSPKRSKVQLRSLDRRVCEALNRGESFASFMKRERILKTSGNARLVEQIWKLRTNCSRAE